MLIYGFIFFKEINSDGPFHLPGDCQHNFLYRPLRQELFLYLRFSTFALCRLYFRFNLIMANLYYAHMKTFFHFLPKHVFKLLFKVRALWFASILNSLKTNFYCGIEIVFLLKKFQTIKKKRCEKDYFAFLKKRTQLIYWTAHVYIYIYIYTNKTPLSYHDTGVRNLSFLTKKNHYHQPWWA